MPNDTFRRPSLSMPEDLETNEIIVPHGADIHPVTAVKNVVLLSSLTQLENGGHLERYTELVDPEVLERVRSGLATEWAPIELAEAHYQACDGLGLNDDELAELGRRVGDRLQATTLVSSAKKVRELGFDHWEAGGSLYRMWARLYQGGSVQVVKVAARAKVLELVGFRLGRYRYYRNAQLFVIRAAHEALGAHLESVRNLSYNAVRDEMRVRIAWL